MSTAVTSINWAILFRRQSVTDQDTYSFTVAAASFTEGQVKDLVRRLEKLGYIEVTYSLRVVLP